MPIVQINFVPNIHLYFRVRKKISPLLIEVLQRAGSKEYIAYGMVLRCSGTPRSFSTILLLQKPE